MTTPKQSPTPSLDSVSDLLSRQSPPDSSTVEPRSSRFTVVSVIVVVEQDGERHSLHFEGSDIDAAPFWDETVIGVNSIRVAEALEGR